MVFKEAVDGTRFVPMHLWRAHTRYVFAANDRRIRACKDAESPSARRFPHHRYPPSPTLTLTRLMGTQPKRQNKGRAATGQAKQWVDASESAKNRESPRRAPFGARMT